MVHLNFHGYITLTSSPRLLSDIETDQLKPLIGGDAQEFVGKDQDPNKMDLKKIL